MPHLSVAEGFEFWRDEVAGLERPEKEVPYIPIIALAGVYIACVGDASTELTSYKWRRAVLASSSALDGLRQSLTSMFKDNLDDDFDIPIANLDLEQGAAMQHQFAHHSMLNGMPEDEQTIRANELFLAETLGFAAHDHSVAFDPLRLCDQGPVGLRNFYPRTAELVEGSV